ncbi:hypothetical protein StrepF001_43990 [Streptomyces sp. F001]|uniref:hypothetical protein n=1 Tax=Streptomyces sp. F001 TaxID=1510026 RepID=UPI00101E83E0|nr:hypothetical protein [Streptomyces sp. F001]RZB13469.1 hypothetical protein StrepF001_43990 [Streptomyces sp. F001]
MRRLIRTIAPAAALVSVLAATPQALAEDHTPSGTNMLVPGTSVEFSESGAHDAQTRAVAAEDPAAVRATATLCGSGYQLERAQRLPDERRFGTLFTYMKSSTSKVGACAVFDNNLGVAKKMKLKLCPNKTGMACKVDEGTYSQYAGPVKFESSDVGGWIDCSQVTAIMWSNGVPIIDRVMSVAACD